MCAEGWLSIEEEHIREVGLSTLYLPLQRRRKDKRRAISTLASWQSPPILFIHFFLLPVGLFLNAADSTKR